MAQRIHSIRVGILALTFGVGLTLVGCSSGSPAAGGLGGGSSNPECAAAAKDYQAFQSGGSSDWSGLSNALGTILHSSTLATTLDNDIFGVETDALGIASDISQSQGITDDAAQFNSDLQAVAKDCGITLAPYKAS